jgi:RimJ/RimL family protein N-acetyltransferase
MITIKKLDADRWQEYRDLRLEALKNEPLAFSSSYEEELLIPETGWRERIENALFAIENEKLVGMAGFFRNNRLKTNHVCEIFGVYVRREYRDRGIGKQLVAAVMEEIKNIKGITKIKIGVNPTQKAAEHLYLKFGFKPVGLLKKDMRVDGKFYDELWMEKHL